MRIWRHECIKCRHIWWSKERYVPCPKCGNKLNNFHDQFDFPEEKVKELLRENE